MAFIFPQKVLFKHCDPAGIVFFPRYFEMINDCVEAFFDSELGHPFEDIHKCGAVPTAKISAKFPAPSRHGDRLEFQLDCNRIGGASLMLDVKAVCGEETRILTTSVLVFVNSKGRPESWPDTLRAALENFKKGQS